MATSAPRQPWRPFKTDFGRAVSRVLSAPLFQKERRRGSFVSAADTRDLPRSLQKRAGLERAAPLSPIWPCTRWGFPCLRACAWSGGLLPRHFTLTQPLLKAIGIDQREAPRALARSLRCRSALPTASGRAGRFVFCGTFRRQRLWALAPACIPQASLLAKAPVGYAASRPMVLGLSSPGSSRERSPALPKSI